MNQIIVKSSVQSQLADHGIHIATPTSMQTIKNTVMATESTDGALQMSIVKNPIATIIVQESSKRGIWGSTERVKEFAI